MNLVIRSILLTLVFLTLAIFYLSGPSQFPDYDNYLVIAENGGFYSDENDYLFEWFSRGIMKLGGLSAEAKVDLLAVTTQVICVIYFSWIASKKRADLIFGALLIFSLFGFMFMTTIFRAAPAYLCISAFFITGGRLDLPGFFLLLFAVSWHDTAIAVVGLVFLARAISLFIAEFQVLARHLPWALKGIVVIAGLTVLSAEHVRPFLAWLSSVDIGIRGGLFHGDGSHSFGKTVFVLWSIACAYMFVSDDCRRVFPRVFVALLAMLVALFHIVNGIASVRFSFFLLTVVIPLQGYFLFAFEKRLCFRMAGMVVAPMVFAASVVYTFAKVL
jgi:hypothetical protein